MNVPAKPCPPAEIADRLVALARAIDELADRLDADREYRSIEVSNALARASWLVRELKTQAEDIPHPVCDRCGDDLAALCATCAAAPRLPSPLTARVN